MPKRKITEAQLKAAQAYAYRKRRRRVRSTARKALTVAKEVKKMVNKTIENKQINNKVLSTALSTSGYAVGGFFGVLQGTSDGTTSGSTARVGNSVTLLRSQFKFNFDLALNSESYNKIRLIVVQSKEGNQTLALSDVLQYSSYGVDGDLVFASPYTTKTSTNKRYEILFDRVFELNGSHMASRQISFVKKYGKTGRVVNWNGNSSSSPTDFKTTVMCISDSTVAPHPTFEYSLRHTYKDA